MYECMYIHVYMYTVVVTKYWNKAQGKIEA
jgi:hypothetical protein